MPATAKDPELHNRAPANDCPHSKCVPAFDLAAALALPNGGYEVRKRWPRFDGTCPDCGLSLIVYASNAHYALGDW